MKRRRATSAKGVGASGKPAGSSSSSDKEDAQAQGFAGAEAAVAEAKEEDGEKARMAGGGGGDAAAEMMEGWEEWRWWTGEVAGEEAVSFGSVWSPFWDVEFMGDEACNALFGDVAWEDDLWSLNDLEKPKGSRERENESH